MRLEELSIDALVAHPDRANHMDAATLPKLRRSIEHAGEYTPLVVRPHPQEEGRYQIIDGHNRLRVLKVMGRSAVQCVVWQATDETTLLYLATLNGLVGKDIPERRAMLIETLLQQHSEEELTGILPDKKKQIEKLCALARISLVDSAEPSSEGDADDIAGDVAIMFVLHQSEASEVELALELASYENGNLKRSEALLQMARAYLSRDGAEGAAAVGA